MQGEDLDARLLHWACCFCIKGRTIDTRKRRDLLLAGLPIPCLQHLELDLAETGSPELRLNLPVCLHSVCSKPGRDRVLVPSTVASPPTRVHTSGYLGSAAEPRPMPSPCSGGCRLPRPHPHCHARCPPLRQVLPGLRCLVLGHSLMLELTCHMLG